MRYDCRVFISYNQKVGKLERTRVIESAYKAMIEQLTFLEELWKTNVKSMDGRRDSCTAVNVAIAQFTLAAGLPEFAKDRVNDMHVALGELLAGRTSALLQRADVPTRTPAATDLVNQAIAQVCVDTFRAAGLSAKEAWERTARLFLARGFQNFSISKIKGLAGRFKGPGAKMDPAYGEYQMVMGLSETILASNGITKPYSESVATAVARQLVSKARDMDHRLAA